MNDNDMLLRMVRGLMQDIGKIEERADSNDYECGGAMDFDEGYNAGALMVAEELKDTAFRIYEKLKDMQQLRDEKKIIERSETQKRLFD